jgi:NAD(P)-dependent dehydrogenase (short-subunit alcohol dehydrogenase family)
MQIRLDGRTALVTGGSKGLGLATARALAEAGAAVAIVARGQAALEAARAALPGRIAAVQADVSTAEGCAAAVQGAEAALGPVDILVNNAGTSRRAPFPEVTDADWQADLDLKLFAAIRLTAPCGPACRPDATGG